MGRWQSSCRRGERFWLQGVVWQLQEVSEQAVRVCRGVESLRGKRGRRREGFSGAESFRERGRFFWR